MTLTVNGTAGGAITGSGVVLVPPQAIKTALTNTDAAAAAMYFLFIRCSVSP